ncbi:MAG: amidohydrolase [Holophagales bacterium]|nr:amidohydrolase [Holophagales bacterium]MYD22456.1 amidohydrolase [Holophagales bacterium]MYI34080.1 amidohydrolase [Holophagales bacterium]
MRLPVRARYASVLAAVLGLLLGGCGGEGAGVADLVVVNGRLVTLATPAEAEALAATGGRIVFVGSTEDARSWIGSDTEVLDLEGRLVVPGFIEGHGHFWGVGEAKLQLALGEAGTWDEIVAQVAEGVADVEPGTWILGRGWHQSKWTESPVPSVQGLPTHHGLSVVSPENPVLLGHASGHMAFANARAMELAGIDATTPDPDGGEIVRDADGQPTGALRETAENLVAGLRAESLEWNHAREVVRLAGEECLAKGITSFQDAGSSFGLIDVYRLMADEGDLPLRLWVMVRESNEAMAESLGSYRMIDHGDGFLTVRGIKRSIDGALGSHGAWLLDPYEDMPQSTGLNTTGLDVMEETARLAREHDFQFCVHAIGDRANRETLDLFERTLAGDRTKRWRVEHAQHLHPDDIPRFAELGVIASMQAVHCTSDGPWVPDRLGEHRSAEGAYVWRDLIESGAVVTNGTDAPVEDVDPIASFHASVSRRMTNGEVFFGDQRMTREEALRSYTIDAAYAAFEEESKGSLEVGKLADMTVLSRDIMTVPEEEIPGTQVVYTILGGRVAYRQQQASPPGG